MADIADLPDFLDVLLALQERQLAPALPVLLDEVAEDQVDAQEDGLDLRPIEVLIEVGG